MFSIGWNTAHVTTALICSKCVGSRRVKFCVGNFSFATVKFLSKISFMMVELIKCLVKWPISSGDSIFFSRIHPSQHQFPEISSKFRQYFRKIFNFEHSFCACGLTDFTTGLIAATGFDVFGSELFDEFP